MELLNGFLCCCGWLRRGLPPINKIAAILFLCILLGRETACLSFNDRLTKMLKGPSQHGKKVPRWNPDPETRIRVRRALGDTTFPTDYDDNSDGASPQEFGDNTPSENCSEEIIYQYRDIYESAYRGPVCDIVDARGRSDQLLDLKNCVIVNGFVHLVFMHDLTEEDLKKYRFPKLRVITDYLLVFRMFNLRTLRHMFPNLAVIGGRELFKDYALVLYENPNLKEIGLGNLQFINRGGVRVQKNPMLCYLSTINWERLGRFTKNSKLPSKMTTFLQNREEGQCVDQCGDYAGCDKDGSRELCWGFNLCQKKICPSQCPYSCQEDLSCGCHNQCLAGCTRKNDPTACIACRDKYFNGTCLGECPDGKFLIFSWLCIEKEECQKVGWTFYKNECQSDCPPGYKVKRTNCTDVCTKCTSDCGKVCAEDKTITDVESLNGVIGCSEIAGALTINIKGGSEVVERLDESLKHLKVIGTLIVRRSFPLITLSFLKNIRRITGKGMEQEIYSVYILENQNLKELWNFTEQKTVIDAGKAFFHFNPRLCLSEVHKVERLTPGIEDNKDISDTTNGDKAICVFVPIKVLEILIYQEPVANIRWENFVMKDERTLIGYQVFYKESPLQNAKKNEGVDACRLNSWTIVDKTKSEDAVQFYPLDNNSTNNNSYFDPGKTSKLISHLKSYTQYAFYIQAYTTSTAESGAASEIQYFMTKPDQPSQPRNLHTTGTTTSSIDIEWDPPASPNGKITHYIVEWLRQEEEDLPSVRAVDTCKREYRKNAPTTSTPKPSDADKSKVEESASAKKECICECEQDQITKEAEIEVQESSNFENYLQNHVFFGKPEYDQVFDDDLSFLDYEDSKPNTSRYRRSIVKRSADSVNISSIVNSTTASTVVSPYTVNVTMENETTPAPERPRFKKFRKVVLGQTKTTLTDLHHYSEYNIQVYACNHASDPRSENDLTYKIKDEIPPPIQFPRVHKTKYVKCSIEAMTVKRTAPNKTVDVIPPESVASVIQNKGTPEETTTLYWMMPKDPNAYVRTFLIDIVNAENENSEIVYCAHVNSSVQEIMSYNFSLHPLGAGNYLAKIRPITLAGEGNWTAPVAFEVKDAFKSNNQTIIIVTVVIAFFIVILIVIAVVCLRMRKKPMDLPTYADYNPDYQRYIYIADEYEIDTEKVTILEEIGHGNFGKVFAGIARSIVKGEEETKVAIKRLHENALPARRFEFLKEASIMKAFNAHHVVRLLGVISKTGDPMVIMEFMEKGDLKCFLRSRRDNAEENSQHLPAPSLQEKLQMAAEIADGMAYLAAYKFVHRDLAARNCLVNGEGTVKIGDFGLTRDIYETDYYRKESRGFLPIRWMAPESLKDGIFDSRSDVWSYGVVLWELATLAEQPYHGLPHDEVTKFVIDGGYMEKPRNCPKRLYDLMTLCWQYNPKMRPIFLEIVQELDRDVNEEFKEVCFYGKHDQVSSAEEDDGQFLHQHENSDGAGFVYPRNDNHLGSSSGKGFAENNLLPPGWNAGDHAFKTQKNSVKSGQLSTTPLKTENEEKMGLLAPELPPSLRILESPNTTTTTAPTTPASCGDRRTTGNRYSSESLYENCDDDVRLSKSKDPNLRDSGAFLSTNRNPKSGDKDPLEFYKHLNGGHKHTKDWDVESGVDDSSMVSPSNPPTPTEMHATLPSEGENDDSIPFLTRATTSSNC